MTGQDAFGPKKRGEQSLLEATRSLIDGAKRVGVKRLLVVVGGEKSGSLEVAHGAQLVDTPAFPAAWKANRARSSQYIGHIPQRNRSGLDLSEPSYYDPIGRTDRKLPDGYGSTDY